MSRTPSNAGSGGSARDDRLQGLDQQALLRRLVLNRQMRREPVLHHLADALRRLVRERGRVGEYLEVVLLPAELGQLLDEHLVVGLDRLVVGARRSPTVGNSLEDRGDLRLDRLAVL